MKTIGLIGGSSPEATANYYRMINAEVRRRRGRLHTAPILLHSLDCEQIIEMQRNEAWDAAARLLCEAGRGLYDAGAECVVLCTNTMHCIASILESDLPSDMPLLHIGDAAGAAIRASGLRRVCLFGTRFTMEQSFLSDYLYTRYGVETVVPARADRMRVHEILYDELYRGLILPESRQELEEIALMLHQVHSVEAVLLASTELTLLLGDQTGSFPLPRFDTTRLHAQAAANYSLSDLAPALSNNAPLTRTASGASAEITDVPQLIALFNY